MWPFCFMIDDPKLAPCLSYFADYHKEMFGDDPTGLALHEFQKDTLIGRSMS